MGRRSLFTAWIACAILGHSACAPQASSERGRGILVIAIDGLRYDHLGASGYDRKTSPALDVLAKEGVFFEAAYSAAPWQVPAHMALISGADPRIARKALPANVAVNQASLWHLPEAAPHPAAEFLSHGFSTAMFYDHPNLSPVYGYDRGFELYQGFGQEGEVAPEDLGSEAVFRRFQQWLALSTRDKSWFAYLELADLERVWDRPDARWDTRFNPRPELSRVPPVGDAQHLFFALPRSRWSGGGATLGEYESRYDGAIGRIDQAFAALRTQLEQMGRWEDTTIVVVGAYGMSFGESGLLLDSGTFSDVDLHVPLIVRTGSGLSMQPGNSKALVSTLDVMPTMLGLYGISISDCNGISFAPVLAGTMPRGVRQQVQASCAYQEGFATLHPLYCYERTWPGRVDDPHLSSSWFGDSEPHLGVVREVLHDRRVDSRLGHLSVGNLENAMAKELAQSGEEYARAIEKRRAELQGEQSAEPAGTTGGR
ncbi:MAG TPA: sulfatase [Planctomycetota bacterium]|nr:sulfatase [Planctomycetota bacterium]